MDGDCEQHYLPSSALTYQGLRCVRAAPTAASARAEENDSDREQEWLGLSRQPDKATILRHGQGHHAPWDGGERSGFGQGKARHVAKNNNKRAENRGKPLQEVGGLNRGIAAKPSLWAPHLSTDQARWLLPRGEGIWDHCRVASVLPNPRFSIWGPLPSPPINQ